MSGPLAITPQMGHASGDGPSAARPTAIDRPLRWLARCPPDQPVALLHSGRFHPRWSRRSILALPKPFYRHDRPDPTHALGPGTLVIPANHPHPWRELRESFRRFPDHLHIGCLSYDLARSIEQLPSRAREDRGWPWVVLHRCPPGRWATIDHLPGGADEPGGVAATLMAVGTETAEAHGDRPPPPPLRVPTSPPTCDLDPDAYRRAVARALDYIAAGDIFQVNLARRITAPLPCPPRELYARLARASPAWYGAFMELPDGRSLASISPELFLDLDAGVVTTRPIKGTRPVSSPGGNPANDPAAAELLASPKDAAELNMIIDLLRNDLGRVCDYGSIRVTEPRHVETHPTVHQGVATIRGRLHRSRDLVDLLRATFPGGSIVGAPKVRAMAIIDELEPHRRGPYCGAIGYALPADGRMQWSIAIRTALLDPRRSRLDYSVGAGIVADSDPHAEYEETRDKAAALAGVLGWSDRSNGEH